MKKFFALMLVVAMLSIAGTAMAAAPTLTATSSTLSIQAGASTAVTTTITATAGNPNGQLGAITVTGTAADFATVTPGTGNSVTVSVLPDTTVAAGSYTLTATVEESYVGGEDVGHTVQTARGALSTPITVTVTKAAAGTTTAKKVVEVVTVVVTKVRVISMVVQRSAVVETFEEVVTKTVTTTFTTTVLQKIEGFTSALVTLWSNATKVAAVETKRAAAVTEIASNPTKYFRLPAGVSAAALTPRANNTLKAAKSSYAAGATAAQKLAAATAKLGTSGKALSAMDAMEATETGVYSQPKTFGKDLYNTPIRAHNGKRTKNVSASFFAADADDTGVSFINSSGDVVTTIPGEEKSADIMPGYVTMLIFMEKGEVYEPIIYATDDNLAGKIDTAETEVSFDEVAYEEKTVTVTVNEDGTVTETVIEPASTTVANKMATAMGGTSATFLEPVAGASLSDADVKKDADLAASTDVHIAYQGTAITVDAAGVYYANANFAALPSSRDLASNAKFAFYPDGLADGMEAYVKIFNASGDEITKPADVLGKEGTFYYAFVAESGSALQAADLNNTLTRPTIVTDLKPVSGSVKPTPGPDSGDQPAVVDTVFEDLKKAEIIDSSNKLTDKAFVSGSKPTLSLASDGTWTTTVSLTFDVSSWTLAVEENGSVTKQFSSSTIGTGSLTPTSSNAAKISLDPSEITFGQRAVTLTVTPKGATHTASVSLGNVIGTATPSAGNILGSSGGGCSAGSAVLALALLGSFILTRKK